MRDTRADSAYFDRVAGILHSAREADDEFLSAAQGSGGNPSIIAVTGGDALKIRWDLFRVEYSAGASVEHLRAEFDGVVMAAERAMRLAREHFDPGLFERRFAYGKGKYKDFYSEWLSLVSLALVFDVDDVTFDRVVAAVEVGCSDRVLSRLVASRRPGFPIAEGLGFPRVTSLLDEAFEAGLSGDKAAAEKLVGRYLSKWYTLWKGVRGWGGHEYQDTLEYWGYWAFEVLGVVKALGLDDSSFRDNEFYPRDLAG